MRAKKAMIIVSNNKKLLPIGGIMTATLSRTFLGFLLVSVGLFGLAGVVLSTVSGGAFGGLTTVAVQFF